jgi:hypothetical protein
MKTTLHLLLILFFCFPIFFSGCNDNTVESSNNNYEISYTSFVDTVDKSLNTLTFDSVKVLLKNVYLNKSGSIDSQYYSAGPFVIVLKMDKVVRSMGIADGGNIAYHQLKYEVHKLQPTETISDPEFKDSISNYFSIVARGYFNGSAFVYKTSASAYQILTFPADITFNYQYMTNITLYIKPLIWFRRNGDFMDPRDPLNFNEIDNNIKNNVNQSFRAFKDNNKDGSPDN